MQRVSAMLALALCTCSAPPARSRDDAAIRVEPVRPRTQDGPAIEYTLRFPSPATHTVDVQMVVPAPADGSAIELVMPVWTPGSYLVREFSRQVESVQASSPGGDVLPVEKVRKNRWRIKTLGADRVVARYRVHAAELSCRTSFVNDELAIINPASVLMTDAAQLARPHDVALELPPVWSQVVTALPPHPAGGAHRYLAASYDHLVDSPLVAGNPVIRELAVDAVPHVLTSFAGGPGFDHDRAARDLPAVLGQVAKFWGAIPYPRYLILNVLIDGGCGLEHAESTLLTVDPWRGTRDAWVDWLRLVVHEHFHAWNVKRLRPVELGPFDYENEVYTRSLWIAEGLTSYYEHLLMARAGFYDRDKYLEKLSADVAAIQRSPGRLVHALSATSYDAWIKFYRRDASFVNTTVSYYDKGAVVGFLLDAAIRRRTSGEKSLDDVMRLAYTRYAGERGYTPDQFREVAEEVAGESLAAFWADAIDGTAELDYTAALAMYGLEFAPEEPPKPGDRSEPAGWLGARTEDIGGGRIEIIEVPRDTPAHAAGLAPGDELIALDDFRIEADRLEARLANYRPRTKVRATVAREGKLRAIDIELGELPKQTWKLRPLARATVRQKRALDAWLQIPAPAANSSSKTTSSTER